MTTEPPGTSSPVRFRGHPLDLERLTYATIVLMSLLAVFDGWDSLSVAEAALVMVAPVLALASAHLFSEALNEHAALHRPLTRREWRRLVERQAQLFLTVVPPMLLLAIGRSTDVDVERVTLVILSTGVVTLMGLAAVAGHHAGMRGWRLVATVVAGGLVGLVVVSLQVLLKPG